MTSEQLADSFLEKRNSYVYCDKNAQQYALLIITA